ncbi:MAG TPA: hypothetical protein VJH88_03095 [Candidatus Nanoarchaeia archaeon]|nr:hypothetical protein [Candidatus Nanoarchaeia archaeon]
MPTTIIKQLNEINEQAADKKREQQEKKLQKVIVHKIEHLQNKMKRLDAEVKHLENKVKALHAKNSTIKLWWYTRKLRIRRMQLDSLKSITPSAKFSARQRTLGEQ